MKHLFVLPASPWDQQPSRGGRSYVPNSFGGCPYQGHVTLWSIINLQETSSVCLQLSQYLHPTSRKTELSWFCWFALRESKA